MLRHLLLAAPLLVAQASDLWGPAEIVTDGDSLWVAGRMVELWGIDAPEPDQACLRNGAEYDCGSEARDALGALVGGQVLTCAAVDRDEMNRVIARCSVAGNDLGALMVGSGQAIAMEPRYQAEEEAAKAGRRGLWSGRFIPPPLWRAGER
ncbi:MAG TPA: thermonuclease family protein [Alphaproteobacteria bacterium]|nr:thermonuclease family protein [Alphaproteobacteria bacterium]